jgi:hypothetical protein
MKKSLIFPLFVLVSMLSSTTTNFAQTLQEARNLRKINVSNQGNSALIVTDKITPLKGKKLSNEDAEVDTTESDGKIVRRKYILRDKYWWKSDSALYDYGDDIEKYLKTYAGVINKTDDSLKSDQFISEKYKGYYGLSALLRDKVKPKNDSVLTEFRGYKSIMRKLFSKTTTTKDQIDTIEEKFKLKKMLLDASYKELQKVIEEFEAERKKLSGMLKGIEDNAKSDKQALAAIPSVSSALGKVTPSITLVGQSTFNSDNWFGEVKLFTGSTQLKPQTENLFIPEASKWGITLNFTRDFGGKNCKNCEGSKTWSGNLNVNYLGKDLYKIVPNEKDKTKTDTSTFSISAFHFKGGLQKIIAKEFVSLYVNHNLLWITEGNKPFKEEFDSTNGVINFWDAGFKCYINLNSNKKVSLSLDLDFIFTNDKIKTYTKSDDRIIPNFKIGLRSDFGI